MQRLRQFWKNIPVSIRKPIVFVVGMLFVITAGLTGWLPGPGGIPLFLIGIAILATEFEWAERIKQYVLSLVKKAGGWIRRHQFITSLLITVGILFVLMLVYILF